MDKKLIAVNDIDGIEEIFNRESHPIKKFLATGGRHRNKNTFAVNNGGNRQFQDILLSPKRLTPIDHYFANAGALKKIWERR